MTPGKTEVKQGKFVEFISPGKRIILGNGINLNPNMFTLGIIQIIVKKKLVEPQILRFVNFTPCEELVSTRHFWQM